MIDLFAIRGFKVILNCDVMRTPFKYLGMPVGVSLRESLFGMVWLKESRLETGKVNLLVYLGESAC